MPEPTFRSLVLWLLITLISIPGLARQEAAFRGSCIGKANKPDTLRSLSSPLRATQLQYF